MEFDPNHSKQLRDLANEHLKIKDFRPGQLEAMDRALSGMDLFILMPTASGKSLIFVLVAMWTNIYVGPGTTIVVVPTISLMRDSVTALRRQNIDAEPWHSETPRSETKRIQARLKSNHPPMLLYVCPERMSQLRISDELKRLSTRGQLHRIVLDECDLYASASQRVFRHCVC